MFYPPRTQGMRLVRVFLSVVVLTATGAIAAGQEGGATNPGAPPPTKKTQDAEGILNLDIEQLAKTPVVAPSTPLSMDAPVTSVTKEQSTVGHSSAAVFVITNEMIRRSGVTSIPEALRMAPGMEVAHLDANTWAISCRGFDGRFANKLLVLIDGRTLYNPITSGVQWDRVDYLLEDVDRIEVIRGPGGTLWGANAVNGVINIITKDAKNTQGAYVTAGGGTQERLLDGFRYGGQVGEDLSYRIYGKHFERGPAVDPTDGDPDDAWRQGRFGFRVDWNPNREKTDTVTVQGDHLVGESETTDLMAIPSPPFGRYVSGNTRNTGENVLVRWRHVYDEDSDWTVQTYYDGSTFGEPLLSTVEKAYDVDFQYRFRAAERHLITCGASFRSVYTQAVGANYFALHYTPLVVTLNTPDQFVQDEITLSEDLLTMTIGCKLEENPFTGLEYQPSARLLWTPDRRHSAWGAVSRAVRTPSLSDEDVAATLPTRVQGMIPRVYGSHSLSSEAAVAYELGYRTQATERFSWDIATFYNVYDHLLNPLLGRPFLEINPPPPHAILPAAYANIASGDTYGVELASNWSISDRWRLYAQYAYLQVTRVGANLDLSGGADPHNQIYLRSSWDLRPDMDFDLMARWVDYLPGISPSTFVPGYISMDLRLGWRPKKHWEVAVVGQNLLQSSHLEFAQRIDGLNTPATEVPRGVYGTVTWRY